MDFTPNALSGGAVITATGRVNYIQDFTKAMCQEIASSNSITVYDKRDEKDYQVRYINGNCWMVSNLRFMENTLSSSSSNVASTYTDANPYKINNDSGWKDLKTVGSAYTEAALLTGVDSSNNPTAWYNYAGASAGTITGTSNTNAQVYDICPKNWHMPSKTNLESIFTYMSSFSPVWGGIFYSGKLQTTYIGGFHASTLTDDNAGARWQMVYNSNDRTAQMGGNWRHAGSYLRCIRTT